MIEKKKIYLHNLALFFLTCFINILATFFILTLNYISRDEGSFYLRVSNLKMDGLQEMFLTGHNAILVQTTNAFYVHIYKISTGDEHFISLC